MYLREVERDAHAEHAVGPDAGIHRLKAHDAAEHQPGADEEHERDRHLRDDERAAKRAPPGRNRPAAFLNRGREAHAARQRGNGADEHAGRGRDPQREQQNGPVQRNLLRPGRELSGERDEQIHRDRREEEADDGAGERQQRALGQELPDQAPSARAERHPDRQLALALQQPREEQVGDARADDEEEKPRGAEQNPERRPEPARQLVAQRHRRRGEPRARRGSSPDRPAADSTPPLPDRSAPRPASRPAAAGRTPAPCARCGSCVTPSDDRKGHADTGM